MQKCAIKLTNHQLKLAADTDYPITKNQVISNISLLFDELGKQLQQKKFDAPFDFLNHAPYKITRGENYHGLPYVVLDYPKIASNDFPVLMRTLFWWGKYFSFNFIVQDEALVASININAWLNDARELYMLKGSNKWNNDIFSYEYIRLNSPSRIIFNTDAACVRLATTLPIAQYEDLMEYAEFYTLFTSQE